MGAITTTTFSEPIGYPNQQYIDRENFDGNLWFAKRVSQTQVDIYKSADNGASWSNTSVTFTRSNLQEISGLFVDSNGHIHMLYRVYESGTDRVYYRRLVADQPAFEAEQLVVGASTGAAGNVYTGLDVIAFKLSGVWYVHMAVGTRNGVNGGVTIFSATVTAAGVFTMRNTLISGYRQWINGPDGVVHPTIMFESNGDGKNTAGSPTLWLVWGRSTIYTARFTWTSGPLWISPNTNTPSAVASLSPNQPSNTAVYDTHGSRCLVAFPTGSVIRIAERSVDNTTQVQRDTPTHPAGVTKHCALSVSAATSNMRVYAVGTSDSKLYFTDYDRAADTWTSWTAVSASPIIGATATNYSVRRTNSGNGHFDSVITTGTSPYDLISTSNTAASSPYTPSLSAPANGVAQNVSATLTFDWDFTDDDPSDFQDSYALRRTIGATTTYWNAAGSSWDASEVFNASGTTAVTLASGWGSDSDASHFYSVRVKDQQGNSSNYSAQVRVIPSAKDNPTITSPTAAPTTALITVSWTVASQTAYRILITKSGVVVRDTGWVTSTATSVLLPDTFLAQPYVLNLTTRNDEGLTGDTQTLTFTPAYPVPTAANFSLAALSATGRISTAITNPDPTGDQALNTTNDVYRREVGDTGNGVKVGSIGVTTPLNLVAPYHMSFESTGSSANWGTANGAVSTAARDTSQFHSGVASFAQTAVNGTGFAGVNFGPLNQFAATPGQQFTLSFWFKATAGMGIKGAVGWRTAANTSNGTPSTGATVTATGAWQLYTMTTTAAPSNTAFAFPSLAQSSTANAAGDKCYVDDVSFSLVGATATPVTHEDFTPASGVAYEYKIVTTAVNGAVTETAWSA